jgi:hypothetical protein
MWYFVICPRFLFCAKTVRSLVDVEVSLKIIARYPCCDLLILNAFLNFG